MIPGTQPDGPERDGPERDGPEDQDDVRDEAQDRPGQLTARPGRIVFALAVGLLFIGWVLYRLIDAQHI